MGRFRLRMGSGVPCALSEARKAVVLKGLIRGVSSGEERSKSAGMSEETYRFSGVRKRSGVKLDVSRRDPFSLCFASHNAPVKSEK